MYMCFLCCSCHSLLECYNTQYNKLNDFEHKKTRRFTSYLASDESMHSPPHILIAVECTHYYSFRIYFYQYNVQNTTVSRY